MWKEEVKARIPEFDFTLKNQLVEWWLTPSDCLWRVLLRALCKIYNNIKIKFVSSPEVADFRDLVACLSLSTPLSTSPFSTSPFSHSPPQLLQFPFKGLSLKIDFLSKPLQTRFNQFFEVRSFLKPKFLTGNEDWLSSRLDSNEARIERGSTRTRLDVDENEIREEFENPTRLEILKQNDHQGWCVEINFAILFCILEVSTEIFSGYSGFYSYLSQM